MTSNRNTIRILSYSRVKNQHQIIRTIKEEEHRFFLCFDKKQIEIEKIFPLFRSLENSTRLKLFTAEIFVNVHYFDNRFRQKKPK